MSSFEVPDISVFGLNTNGVIHNSREDEIVSPVSVDELPKVILE